MNRDVTNLSTPEVILKNQSFLDSLSAKLSVGANIKLQQPSSTQQVSVNSTKVSLNPNQTSLNQINPSSSTIMQRSPSFGSTVTSNGSNFESTKTSASTSVAENSNTNDKNFTSLVHSDSSSKNTLNAEIETGTFNLRKTNGIMYDRSAPKF